MRRTYSYQFIKDHIRHFFTACLSVFLISGYTIPTFGEPPPSTQKALSAKAATPIYGYEIINIYPHDKNAFTQGLFFENGRLYESTGRYGHSSLREVNLETGAIRRSQRLARDFFGEGMTIFKDRIIWLTWKSHTGFVYDKENFNQIQTFYYPTEGWGITHDGTRLIMSNGTPILYFLDPETFAETGRIGVHDNQKPVGRLNELEYINGEIYANVWQTNCIARISPQTGNVLAWINLTGLSDVKGMAHPVDVLNGIAYDSVNDRLFVTGKLWNRLFEIKLVRTSKLP